MPMVRVDKKTLKALREVQGYFQMASGKKLSDDQTIAELCLRFRKVFPVEIGDKTFMLEIETQKQKRP